MISPWLCEFPKPTSPAGSPQLPLACADAQLRKPAGDELPCSFPLVEEPGLPLRASSPRSGPNPASGEWVRRFPLTGWHRAGTEGAHIG